MKTFFADCEISLNKFPPSRPARTAKCTQDVVIASAAPGKHGCSALVIIGATAVLAAYSTYDAFFSSGRLMGSGRLRCDMLLAARE